MVIVFDNALAPFPKEAFFWKIMSAKVFSGSFKYADSREKREENIVSKVIH